MIPITVVESTDEYLLVSFPYFSSATDMFSAECKGKNGIPCYYYTGKDSERGARKRIADHWKDKNHDQLPIPEPVVPGLP